MKIRGKLMTGMSIIVVGFVVSLMLLIVTTNIANSLQDLELSSVNVMKNMYRLTDQTKDLMLTNDELGGSFETWKETLAEFDNDLTLLVSHTAKKQLPPELRESLEYTENTWKIIKSSFQEIDSILGAIIAAEVPEIPIKVGVLRTQMLAQDLGIKGQFTFDLGRIQQRLSVVDRAGRDFIVDALGGLNEGIKIETERTLRQNRIYSLLLAAGVVIGALAFIIVFSGSFANRIGMIENAVRKIAARDLSVRTSDTKSDEIGSLSRNLNDTLSTLSGFMEEVHSAAHNVEELKEALSAGTTESAAALNEITKNIESIRERFIVLDKNITSTTQAVSLISGKVLDLDNGIAGQSQAIEAASSAIEEMTASIGSVAKLSKERKESADELLNIIQQGGEHVEATNEYIKSISREIDNILEIIEIINHVSEQTNLLSMNAAIESAHAGEAGKGFAVVAEEIRKLAESTKENSASIGKSLNSVTQKIRDALVSSNAGHETFEKINLEVKNFAGALTEISTNMDELSSASRDILDATSKISEVSGSIRQGSLEMEQGIGEIERAMKDSEGISAEVVNGIGEIDNGAREILQSLLEISRLTTESRERMEKLHNSVGSFTTGTELEETPKV